MSRQIDVKALVSHIVRGDGADKCRICMGDTSEGQVYLTDTVMLDGDRPVTLSELLETITGIEVILDAELPAGVCRNCCKSALNANKFRKLCLEASTEWHKAMILLNGIDITEKNIHSIYCVIENNVTIFEDVNKVFDSTAAADRLTTLITYRENMVKSDMIPRKCPDCGKEFRFSYLLFVHLKEASHNLRACYVCAEIVFKKDLLQHLVDVHKVQPYNCKQCKTVFKSHIKYEDHLEKDHTKGNFSCIECRQSFLSSLSYRAHKVVHESQFCLDCGKTFQNHKCYVYHIKICCNLINKPLQIKPNLQVEMENKIDPTNGIDQQSASNKKCYCDYCGKIFAGRRFVSAHIQIVHMKNTHKPCIHCGKHYAAARMSDHIKSHQSKLYKCQYCSLELKTKLGFLQHTRLHTGERPYSCKYCTETFSALSRRSEHIRRVHLSSELVLKHKCSLCLASFKLPYRLRKHMASVHGVADNDNVFECSICSQKFSRSGLVHHMKKHQRINIYI